LSFDAHANVKPSKFYYQDTSTRLEEDWDIWIAVEWIRLDSKKKKIGNAGRID
jgi:hypothetical protein